MNPLPGPEQLAGEARRKQPAAPRSQSPFGRPLTAAAAASPGVIHESGRAPTHPGLGVKFSFAFDKGHLERCRLRLALQFFFPRLQRNGLTSRSAPRGRGRRGVWRSRLQFLRRHVPRRGFRSAQGRGERREAAKRPPRPRLGRWGGRPRKFAFSGNPEERRRGGGKPSAEKEGQKNPASQSSPVGTWLQGPLCQGGVMEECNLDRQPRRRAGLSKGAIGDWTQAVWVQPGAWHVSPGLPGTLYF